MRLRNKALATLALSAALFSGMLASAVGGQEKVTICHAAGQDDTTHFVELTLAYPAVYGQAGHFYENGTPRAGHESDYIGPCVTPSTTSSSTRLTSPSTTLDTTTTTGPTTNSTSSTTSTTTLPVSTTVTVPEDTSTTTSLATTTTVPPATTTTTEPPKELPLTGPEDLIPIALTGVGLLSLGVLALRRTGYGAEE